MGAMDLLWDVEWLSQGSGVLRSETIELLVGIGMWVEVVVGVLVVHDERLNRVGVAFR